MSDTACGKNRLPFPPETDPAIIACETAEWEAFASSCGGCATPGCVDQLYQLYLDRRAKCAEGPD